jgi:hypothetical protein
MRKRSIKNIFSALTGRAMSKILSLKQRSAIKEIQRSGSLKIKKVESKKIINKKP